MANPGHPRACRGRQKGAELLNFISWASIGVAIASALWIAVECVRRPQRMGIMNVVWPVTGLYFSVLAVWGYYRPGTPKTGAAVEGGHGGHGRNQDGHGQGRLMLGQIAVGTSHCGAGCMLADLVCEFTLAGAGLTVLGSALLARYVVDFCGAWVLGVVFQYFAIAPMRQMSTGEALVAAMKADTLSIAAFQVGMYAWMALSYFVLFPRPHLTPFDAPFWLMMQIAMVCGYGCSFPMNRWLIKTGVKEAMQRGET
jgi:Domain of unknown function (DUF4396)